MRVYAGCPAVQMDNLFNSFSFIAIACGISQMFMHFLNVSVSLSETQYLPRGVDVPLSVIERLIALKVSIIH